MYIERRGVAWRVARRGAPNRVRPGRFILSFGPLYASHPAFAYRRH